MSLLFIDGAEHLAIASLTRKFASVGSSVAYVSTPAGRLAGRSYQTVSAPSLGATVLRTPVLSPATPREGILGYAFYVAPASTFSGTNVVLDVLNAGSVQLSLVFLSDRLFRVRLGSYVGTTIATATVAFEDGWNYVDFGWYLDNASGVVDVRLWTATSGNLGTVAYASGVDTQATSSAAFDQALWYVGPPMRDIYVLDRAGSRLNYFLGNSYVLTSYVDVATSEDLAEWSSTEASNRAAVDDTDEDGDSTYVSSAVAGDRDRYVLLEPDTYYTTHAVQLCVTGRKLSSAFASTMNPTIRISGTDYPQGAQTLSTGYVTARAISELNPSTGDPWTAADIVAARWGQDRSA